MAYRVILDFSEKQPHHQPYFEHEGQVLPSCTVGILGFYGRYLKVGAIDINHPAPKAEGYLRIKTPKKGENLSVVRIEYETKIQAEEFLGRIKSIKPLSGINLFGLRTRMPDLTRVLEIAEIKRVA